MGIAKGISLQTNGTGSSIVFNSVNITGTDVVNGQALELLGGTDYVIKNNIFANNGGGYAAYIGSLPSLKSWDYNCYYSSGNNFGYYNGQNYSQLNLWGAAISGDPNSKKLNPFYQTSTDLLPSQRQINGAGIASSGVLLDIDGELRNQQAPDVGAQEFMVDFGVTRLVSPTNECSHTANESVVVFLRQFGDIPFTNIKIAYRVNNGTIYTDIIPGTITNDLTYTFNQPQDLSLTGNYVFKVWLVDNQDDNPNNDTLTVTRVNKPAPVVDFSFITQCANVSVPFTGSATISSGFIARYEWEFGDTATAIVQNPVHMYDSAATYQVTMRAFSDQGCYTSITKPIVLKATPISKFTVANACDGNSVVINNQTAMSGGSSSISYSWNFGDGSTSTQSSPTHLYSAPGNYYINLTATSTNGCLDTSRRAVRVYPVPVLSFNIDPVYIISSSYSVLVGTPSAGVFSGPGVTNNLFFPALAGAGTWGITYTYTDPVTGCTRTLTKTVTVIEPPSIRTNPQSQSVCVGSSVTLGVNARGTNISYQWYKNGNILNGQTTATLSFSPVTLADANNYTVRIANSVDTIFSSVATLSVNVATSSTVNASFCSGTNYTLPNGTSVSSPGTYVSIIPNNRGCDSTITTVLTISSGGVISQSVTSCDSYVWSRNGQTYTQSGTYTSASTCNTYELILTITPRTTVTTDVSSCDVYQWSANGQTYTQSGSYTTEVGCVTKVLNLTITQSTTNSSTVSACVSYTWPINGQTYTETGSYTSVNGCQTEALNLTITPQPIQPPTACYETATFNSSTCSWDVTGSPAPAIVTTASACGSYTWSVNGQSYTSSGDYTFSENCQDYTLNLTINQATTSTINASINEGESYSFNGQNLSTAGTYNATLQNAAGCDSLVTLNLTVNPVIEAGCYASTVVDFVQGLNSTGGAVPAIRSNATQALGQPEAVVTNVVNFVSLGFGGTITVAFQTPIANGDGNDIHLDEATWGNNPCSRYPEKADVFASQDGTNFIYLGQACQDASFDLGTLSWAKYIRLVDVSDVLSFNTDADGYDLNGIECLNGSATNPTNDGLQACTLQEIVSYTPGNRKNGTAVPSPRNNANNALGEPQSNNTVNFVSLGFGGTLVAKFDYVVFNQPGNDLRVTETSFGNPSCTNYPEKARVSLSLDNQNWVELGEICQDGTIEMGTMLYAQYIRIQDASSMSSTKFNSAADGYDVDAVVVLNNGCGNATARLADADNTTTPNEDFGISVFPNPMQEFTTIRFDNLSEDAEYTLELFDGAGRLIQTQKIEVSADMPEFTMKASDLAHGIYQVVIHNETTRFMQRLVK